MTVAAPAFLTLEAALEELGQAWVLIGNPHVASSLAVLGLTPGDFAPTMNPQFQERRYEEYSRQPLESKIIGYEPVVDIPLIWGDPAVYAKITPTGAAAGGHTSPQNPTYTTLVIVPHEELKNGWEVTAGAWVTPAGGPKHAIWFPKGYFVGAFPVFGNYNTENKNRTSTVQFRGVLTDSANWPEGTKSWLIGDPLDFSVLNIVI